MPTVTISSKLSVGFSVTAAFLLIAGIAAIVLIEHLNETLRDTNFYNSQLEQVAIIERELRVAPQKTSEHVARLNDLEKNWARSDTERSVVLAARQQLTAGRSVSGTVEQLENLATYYRSAMQKANQDLLQLHRRAVIAMVIILADAILLLVLLMYLVRRWLLNPVLQLRDRLALTAAGRFEAQPPPKASDREFSEVSTALDRLNATLKDLTERLEKTERLAVVGEACSHVSHDVRSLLHSIRSLAQHGGATADAKTKAAFQQIVATANKLDNWIRDVIQTTKPLELKLVTQQIEPIIRDSVSLLKPHFAEKEIEVQFHPGEGLPDVALDRAMFERALVAVLNNAIDASPDGGRITISANGDPASHAVVEILDHGDGMSESVRERALEPFFTTKHESAGLGLTIAHSIITRHQGNIEIDSAPNKGTCVRITLPGAKKHS